MSIPREVLNDIRSTLKIDDADSVQTFRLTGGDINEVFLLQTSTQSFCLKYNSSINFPGMFSAEKKGLNELRNANCIRIPMIQHQTDLEHFSYLLLEYIAPGNRSNDFWEKFGVQLAQLHRKTSDHFGLDHDNYMGSLPQVNSTESTWKSFFGNQRLRPQLKMAIQNKRLPHSLTDQLESLMDRISELFPKESPSLIHGDLWSGNYLVDSEGNPVLIDPAVSYSHREMDIAMMHLFGGFDPKLFQAYHEVYPLEPDWRDRIAICNLYPLLVHVNLFGGGYGQQVQRILSKFS